MSCWISVFAGNDSRRLQNIYKWKCYGIIYGRNCSLNFRRKKWCRIRHELKPCIFAKVCGFFLFALRIDFLTSPRAFMRGLSLAERNTPIAQNFVLYSVYFALAGGYHAGYGGGFVNGHLYVHSHWH